MDIFLGFVLIWMDDMAGTSFCSEGACGPKILKGLSFFFLMLSCCDGYGVLCPSYVGARSPLNVSKWSWYYVEASGLG